MIWPSLRQCWSSSIVISIYLSASVVQYYSTTSIKQSSSSSFALAAIQAGFVCLVCSIYCYHTQASLSINRKSLAQTTACLLLLILLPVSLTKGPDSRPFISIGIQLLYSAISTLSIRPVLPSIPLILGALALDYSLINTNDRISHVYKEGALYALAQIAYCVLCALEPPWHEVAQASGLVTIILGLLSFMLDPPLTTFSIVNAMNPIPLLFHLAGELDYSEMLLINIAKQLLLIDLLCLNWRVNVDLIGNLFIIGGMLVRSESTKAYILSACVLAALISTSWTNPYRLARYHADSQPYEAPFSNLLNYSKVATMIEPRNIPILVPLLSQYLANIPEDWPLVVWLSKDNVDTVRHSSLRRAITSGRLNITILPEWVDVTNGENLSRFLTKPWFWEQFQAEWMFFFQSDAVLCSRSTDSIDNWLGYDFVGAPCPWSDGDAGGNGGFSMRKISSALSVTRNRTAGFARPDLHADNISTYRGTPFEAEDWWFFWAIRKAVKDHKFPGDDIRNQNRFSIAYPGIDEMQPLGCHRGNGPGLGLFQEERSADFQRLISWCPEVILLKQYAEGYFH